MCCIYSIHLMFLVFIKPDITVFYKRYNGGINKTFNLNLFTLQKLIDYLLIFQNSATQSKRQLKCFHFYHLHWQTIWVLHTGFVVCECACMCVCYNCTFMVTMCLLQAGRYRSATSQMLVVVKAFILYQLHGQETGRHLEEWFYSIKESMWHSLVAKPEENMSMFAFLCVFFWNLNWETSKK